MGLAFGATRQFEKDLKRLSNRPLRKGNALAPCFANTSINKGKSSGFRLIYADFEGEQYDAAIALSLYCNQAVDNISDQELSRLISEAHVVLVNMALPVFKAQGVKHLP
jgi:hypothetical protein